MIFDSIENKIKANLAKKESGIATSINLPFKRLSQRFPGWTKGSQTIITANSGIGKTKICKFLTVNSIYSFLKSNPLIKVKVFYFALEESKESFWLDMIASILYTNYDIQLSPHQILSLGNYTISKEHLEIIQSVKQEVEDMEKYIEVIDNIFNPYGIYNHVRQYFNNPDLGEYETIETDKGQIKGKFIYKDSNQYVFVVTDQINLLTPDTTSPYGEPQRDTREAMNYFSKEYCLKQMCKRLECTVINIQQQAADKEKQEFFKGASIEKKLEPSLDGLGDSKLTQRDADLVLGLFAPTRYELESYRGYDINKLKDKYRCLIFLKDRHFGLANNYVHLYFNGAINQMKELPKSDEMHDYIYESIIEGTF